MTTRYLGPIEIPADSLTNSQGQRRQRLAKQGLLGDINGSVESISSEPNEFTVTGQYRGRFAEKLATELEELFDAGPEIGPVPFYGVDETPQDGYYSLENIDSNRVDPRTPAAQAFDGRLTFEGTRENSRRAVSTSVAQVENDFGNDQTALVGLPESATDVWWFDVESKQTEQVSVVETRAGEHGQVDVVDALASSFENPHLIYDAALDAEWRTDIQVWDTRGHADKTDSNGYVQWGRVFAPSHTFAEDVIVSNRIVRLRLGESLTVEEYDDSAGAWTEVALGSSDWMLDGWGVTRIGPARVVVRVRFADAIAPAIVGQAIVGESTVGTTSTNNYQDFELDAVLHRGWRRPHWVVPENETPPTPSGLQDLLAPVASGSDYTAAETQGVVSREEVWR
ncbi:hypothetical protein [Halorussus marinus]|uniref:hypothetical protein n=1 Tax=Halorussus marinus TaxID=2505976 RepID=UPI001092FD18|nr:hypothetical protein [Halorussus marinus]